MVYIDYEELCIFLDVSEHLHYIKISFYICHIAATTSIRYQENEKYGKRFFFFFWVAPSEESIEKVICILMIICWNSERLTVLVFINILIWV